MREHNQGDGPEKSKSVMKSTNRIQLKANSAATVAQGKTAQKQDESKRFPAMTSSGKSSPRKRRRSGWIKVNISGWRVDAMRRLAAAQSTPFRLFCENAMRDAMHKASKSLGISSCYDVLQMSPARIDAMAERFCLLLRAQQSFMPEKN